MSGRFVLGKKKKKSAVCLLLLLELHSRWPYSKICSDDTPEHLQGCTSRLPAISLLKHQHDVRVGSPPPDALPQPEKIGQAV